MRSRILSVLGSLLLVIVVLVSTVLMQSVSRDATADLQVNRLSALNRFVQLASHANGDDDLEMLQLEMDTYSQLYGEALLIVADGHQLASGEIQPEDPVVVEALRAATLNLEHTEIPAVNPFSDKAALITRPFGNTAQVLGSVTMNVNLEPARMRVLQSSSMVLIISLAVGAIFLLLADRLATWVIRPLHRLDDSVRLLTRTQRPIPLVDQGPPELQALSRSVSNMAQTMATSLQQQQELIAETSHQLRNPVAALRLRVDLLKMRGSDDSSPDALHAVEDELARVEILLDDVLRLARAEHRLTEQNSEASAVEAGTRRESINALEVLAEEIERQSAVAQASGNTLNLDTASEPVGDALVWCNGFDLQQMVSELLENSMKYAPGTQVELGIRHSGTMLDILVSDQGPGLSAAELASAGERFWRSERVRGTAGTGLGLAIVDRLARANAGQIIVAANEGTGLKIIIRLPRASSGQEGADD
ncbi:HAMP domain-containing histidine kinase [Glutamicibacter sp. JL.03c]|uniref:sensor histidine kinase n=1 Tax=Glutamicibacter sp. JL.03c TaxID=2984842 RepID=UPI0021F6AEDC|nr:HAMP domain-containing sensor histidine kinase [Glutamicibacter sp. JL.03c]UYQ79004.1 HAMP domain-containing histidine kinase [Glutamicibacter sp. JL.03c]